MNHTIIYKLHFCDIDPYTNKYIHILITIEFNKSVFYFEFCVPLIAFIPLHAQKTN